MIWGKTAREVLLAEGSFDWSALAAAGDTLSLFAERKLIELRLPSGKPGDAGSKAFSAYAAAPPPDNLLLLICGKLDKQQQGSKWFKALESAGAVIQIQDAVLLTLNPAAAEKQGLTLPQALVDKADVVRSGSGGPGCDHWCVCPANPHSKVDPDEWAEFLVNNPVHAGPAPYGTRPTSSGRSLYIS